MINSIDAETLKKMFLAGSKNLESKKEWINELNVFPVPDGDTGTNMTITVMSAVKELSKLPDHSSLDEIGNKISTGTLRGARGNSGVIMSQLCRGFVKGIEGETSINIEVLAKAMEKAATTAYRAVMKPKEGTILTVAKAAALKAEELAGTDISLEDFCLQVNEHAEFILSKTPEMLPVLKEAGVVDSGSQGLIEFLHGCFDALAGKKIDYTFDNIKKEAQPAVKSAATDSSNISTSNIEFGYCTEFIIMLEKNYTEKDEDEFKAFLTSIGDSIVCVNMDDIVKVHVHTNHPGNAIEKGLTYGSLTSLKIDNMREEHNEKVVKEADRRTAEEKEKLKAANTEPAKEFGFVSVCAGEGIASIFNEMGVDVVIEGGQTMNPSTDDILSALNNINAKNIFILPNNGNIVMAANQAKDLCEGKNIYVLPSKTICQGINAIVCFDPSASFDDNRDMMIEAIGLVKTGEVTYAVRDTKIDDKPIKKGDFMGIGEGKMLAVSTDLKETVIEMVKALSEDSAEMITLYYGADSDEKTAEEISSELEKIMPDTEITVVEGGQPVYYFFVSVE